MCSGIRISSYPSTPTVALKSSLKSLSLVIVRAGLVLQSTVKDLKWMWHYTVDYSQAKQSPQGVTPSSPPSVQLLVLAVGSEPSSPPRRDTGHISIIIHDSSVRLLWCIWIKTPSSPCALWQNDNHGWLDWQITSVVMILLEWKRAPS